RMTALLSNATKSVSLWIRSPVISCFDFCWNSSWWNHQSEKGIIRVQFLKIKRTFLQLYTSMVYLRKFSVLLLTGLIIDIQIFDEHQRSSDPSGVSRPSCLGGC